MIKQILHRSSNKKKTATYFLLFAIASTLPTSFFILFFFIFFIKKIFIQLFCISRSITSFFTQILSTVLRLSCFFFIETIFVFNKSRWQIIFLRRSVVIFWIIRLNIPSFPNNIFLILAWQVLCVPGQLEISVMENFAKIHRRLRVQSGLKLEDDRWRDLIFSHICNLSILGEVLDNVILLL